MLCPVSIRSSGRLLLGLKAEFHFKHHTLTISSATQFDWFESEAHNKLQRNDFYGIFDLKIAIIIPCPWSQRPIEKWRTLRLCSRKTKWRREVEEGFGCPMAAWMGPIWRRGGVHFKSSGEQIWKSIWNEHKIVAWSFWPYIYAKWSFEFSIPWCY